MKYEIDDIPNFGLPQFGIELENIDLRPLKDYLMQRSTAKKTGESRKLENGGEFMTAASLQGYPKGCN